MQLFGEKVAFFEVWLGQVWAGIRQGLGGGYVSCMWSRSGPEVVKKNILFLTAAGIFNGQPANYGRCHIRQ